MKSFFPSRPSSRPELNSASNQENQVTNPLAYIVNCGAAVYVADFLFFLEEFNRLGRPFGCHLNFNKTRIITSINGTSSILSIAWKYGTAVFDSIV